MINTPPMTAIVTFVPFQASSRSFSMNEKTSTRRTSRSSSGSPFLRMDMLKSGKMAFLCYRLTILGARNGTLSVFVSLRLDYAEIGGFKLA